VVEATHHYGSLRAISDLRVTCYLQPPALTPAVVTVLDLSTENKRLSRPEPTLANDLPKVTTELSALPGVSCLSRPSAPLCRCEQLAHSCYAATDFSRIHSNTLFTQHVEQPPTLIMMGQHWKDTNYCYNWTNIDRHRLNLQWTRRSREPVPRSVLTRRQLQTGSSMVDFPGESGLWSFLLSFLPSTVLWR